jgi:hypothetical protein
MALMAASCRPTEEKKKKTNSARPYNCEKEQQKVPIHEPRVLLHPIVPLPFRFDNLRPFCRDYPDAER